ncbi:MAG: glycine cleavage system protein H [Verrucomicrobiae bacterium]|nr:glycine cleavage system protein H [Verrucomicrobiae bacterium]
MEFIKYRHARFRARFPAHFRYSPSHYWMAPVEGTDGHWRVGFTKFATRMLGELVEAEFKLAQGDPVHPGQEIGVVEGFKAASDVYCVMSGHFHGSNPTLDIDACIVRSDPYIDGWLYEVKGEPEDASMDALGYIELLEKTINRMQEEEHAEDQ